MPKKHKSQKKSGKTNDLKDLIEQKKNNNAKHLTMVETRRRTRSSKPFEENGSCKVDIQKEKIRLKEERANIVLWKHPFQTLTYFLCEVFYWSLEQCQRLLEHKLLTLLTFGIIGLFYIIHITPGQHQDTLEPIYKKLLWCGWWLWLGILSSVGLGTGLHTFILYLGPFIANVTMSAYLCNSLNFPEPPYPDEIKCPSDESQVTKIAVAVTIWEIMRKVRLEAFMWGAGTAIGELPPYFVARASRLSGSDPDDEPDEFEELEKLIKEHPEQMSTLDKAKLMVEKLIEKVGFLGIVLCASIPNPLFDLAGITCGHFRVPFWKFFGATVIGKAFFKMHLQKMCVILLFNEPMLEQLLSKLSIVPGIGKNLQVFLTNYLNNFHQKLKGGHVSEDENILSWIFQKIVILMILYFLLSIVNSFAQSYHKRIHKHSKHNAKAKTQ